MKRWSRNIRGVLALILLFLVLCLTSPTRPGYASYPIEPLSADQIIQSMLDQVSQDKVNNYTGDLSGAWEVSIGNQPYTLSTRHALSGEPATKAAQYLHEFYEKQGLQVKSHPFSYREHLLSNIVAEKPGSVFPERILLITSHFDDLPTEGPAPGADDNASGTTAVMLAAEILGQYDFGCTLRFVNFGAEEYGLIGSEAYARQSYCASEDIRGVINLDMIAWNSPGSEPGMDLHALSSVTGSDELATTFQKVVKDFNLDLTPDQPATITTRSDHASFWKYGFPAILASEDWQDFNPNYHSPGDTLDSLGNMQYYVSMVKAAIGTMARAGCLVDEGWGFVSGQVIDSLTQIPVEGATVQLTNPEWGYTWTTWSDENGYFEFSALGGLHYLKADLIGYAQQNAEVLITRGEAQVRMIELMPVEETAVFMPFSVMSEPVDQIVCP
jgi:hypothetical protein